MNTVSVRMNSEEQSVFNEYAKLTGIPLSTLPKKALEERIENDFDLKSIIKFDLKSIIKYENDITNNTLKTYNHDDVKKMLAI